MAHSLVSLVAQSCLTLCDPMDHSTPDLPVHHQLPELVQTHVQRWHRWCHPTILPSVFPFSWIQYFPATGSFPMSQSFTSGGQSTGASASASVLPMHTQDWFPLGLTGLISLQSKGLSRLLQHHCSTASIYWHSVFFMAQHSHPYMTAGKTIALTRCTFVNKVMSLLFNMLSRFVIAFPLSRSVF